MFALARRPIGSGRGAGESGAAQRDDLISAGRRRMGGAFTGAALECAARVYLARRAVTLVSHHNPAGRAGPAPGGAVSDTQHLYL